MEKETEKIASIRLDWKRIKDELPPYGETLLFWHDYTSIPWPGEWFKYDGEWIRISMRHWSICEPLTEFSLWAYLPETEAERLELFSR